MNKLYQTLDLISRENSVRAKAKRRKEEELRKAAWKTHCKGHLSAFDYVRICNKNNQLAF